jgi:predicted dehydrogenase
MGRVRVGLIGCGVISEIYLKNLKRFDLVEVTACADLLPERAAARAAQFDVPRSCSPAELLADESIEVVLNLTIPAAHGEVALQALEAGKSVYNEKPLAVKAEQGEQMLELARRKGLLVGCAPDTVLGGGIQTCRRLIDEGAIGEPVAASAFYVSRGHESWHPAPEFYYQVGGGPMFDMGPYYLTALAVLLGPARRVTGSARITFPERTITSKPKAGAQIPVEVPTHIAGVVDYASGAVATVVTTFDVWGARLPHLEIYGSEGSLAVPDPNTFGGPVRLKRGGGDWEEMPLSHGYTENWRGLGVADMAYALRFGRPARASGELGQHVLELMHAFHEASLHGRHMELRSTCSRPEPLPSDLAPGLLDH